MNLHRSIPLIVVVIAAVGLGLYGPILQFAHYHDFADQRSWLGMPNALDLWSNLAFLLVGVWGWLRLSKLSHEAALTEAWPGYALFLLALMATALGSSYYHWAPDDARLFWDRLPIALACAGLLAAAFSEVDGSDALLPSMALAIFATASVWWWDRSGDLRLYLLLQVLPLILIPLWQHYRGAPRVERLWFGAALLIYVAARATEIFDVQIYAALGTISGHTLKHLLAAGAAALVIRAVLYRVQHARDDVQALAPLGA